MNTIRWCETHNRYWAVCPFDGRPHDLVDQVRLDPSDPEQVAELLTSRGFEREAKFRRSTYEVTRWVGPWEPVE